MELILICVLIMVNAHSTQRKLENLLAKEKS